jgi:hypothetical protein
MLLTAPNRRTCDGVKSGEDTPRATLTIPSDQASANRYNPSRQNRYGSPCLSEPRLCR